MFITPSFVSVSCQTAGHFPLPSLNLSKPVIAKPSERQTVQEGRSCDGRHLQRVGEDFDSWTRHSFLFLLTQCRWLLSGYRGWKLCRATPPSPSNSKVHSWSGQWWWGPVGQGISVASGNCEIMLLTTWISGMGDRGSKAYSSLDSRLDEDLFTGMMDYNGMSFSFLVWLSVF